MHEEAGLFPASLEKRKVTIINQFTGNESLNCWKEMQTTVSEECTAFYGFSYRICDVVGAEHKV